MLNYHVDDNQRATSYNNAHNDPMRARSFERSLNGHDEFRSANRNFQAQQSSDITENFYNHIDNVNRSYDRMNRRATLDGADSNDANLQQFNSNFGLNQQQQQQLPQINSVNNSNIANITKVSFS